LNIAGIFEERSRSEKPHIAYIHHQREVLLDEMERTASRLASGLEKLGLRPGDRVALMVPNSLELVASYLAIFKAGAVAVPITFSLGPKEIKHIFDNAEPRLVIANAEFESRVSPILDQRETRVIAVGGKAFHGARTYDELIEGGQDEFPARPRQLDDLAALVYTSGSTGLPKGVMLTYRNFIRPGGILFDEKGQRRKDIPDIGIIRSILVIPTSHVYGMIVLFTSFYLPSTQVLLERFDSEKVLRLIQTHKPFLFPGVPTMYRYMLDYPKLDQFDLSSVQVWVSAAAPLPRQIYEEWKARLKKPIIEGYGLTESTAYVSSSLMNLDSKPGSIGKTGRGVKVKIVDENNRELEPGKSGEILIRGPNVMKGYYRQPEETAKVLCDGWLRTGDVGYVDEEGYIFIVDRKKDLIIRDGFNIYPSEIEDALRAHPAVSEASVIGVPHPVHGEVAVAFVELRPDAKAGPEELKSHVRESIARYKVPEEIHIISELPRNFVGKVLKRELRRRYLEKSSAEEGG
jgi:long-chain acyl-CoA synthetase